MSTLLRLLHLADTAFPTGAFAHSLGLEGAHAAGALRDEEDLHRALRRQLDGLATSDLVTCRAAHARARRAGDERAADAAIADLAALDRELDATRPTRETREAARATGERFLLAATVVVDDPLLHALRDAVARRALPGTLPVAWGVAGAAIGADAEATGQALAFSSLAALAAAGQRLIPLGGVATQAVLGRAADAIPAALERAAAIDPLEPCSFVPELDVRSAQHERQRVRLFIS
ncbi:urease accessory UreF family protein [Patulibacter brassicae]|uniref:Urease accessory protein UreF n=1 Tax=Patulibacter brassicae TaxID=1705717 RepID=A0ABU4VN25_9ACTN|nr:urease accessory UreF family protein [Patulibacter brassicae]MDX8152180.1 urease accessory UreF family protein [Patulibacter brassicae]